MKNSIARSDEYEKFYKALGNSQDSIFDTLKDVMVFCAVLALRKNLSAKPFEKRGGDPIRLDIFKSDDRNIIDIIALTVKNDLSILTEEQSDEKYTLFEEYANAGMAYLVERYSTAPMAHEILALIDEFRPEVTYNEPIDLADLVMDSI